MKELREDRRPADLWFWADWFSSFDVRSCSLAARGLWIDMLGIMSRAETKGTLTINGKPLSSKDLAKVVGAFHDEVERLLVELEYFEVFSRLEDGTIYNRRMYKTSRLSKTRSEQGKKGAEARWQKDSKDKFAIDGKPMASVEYEDEDDNDINLIPSVLSYLNEKAGAKFSLKSKANRKHISARIAEGRTLDDFKAVIDKKIADWKGRTWPDTRPGREGKIVYGDDLLRPSTLFGPEKFEQYLNERGGGPAKKMTPEEYRAARDADAKEK